VNICFPPKAAEASAFDPLLPLDAGGRRLEMKAFRWGILPVLGIACLFDATTRPIGFALLVASVAVIVVDWSRGVLGLGEDTNKPDRWA
jgi:hypothetical protein